MAFDGLFLGTEWSEIRLYWSNLEAILSYYSLDISERVIIDTDEFAKWTSLGDDNITEDVDASVEYYEKTRRKPLRNVAVPYKKLL